MKTVKRSIFRKIASRIISLFRVRRCSVYAITEPQFLLDVRPKIPADLQEVTFENVHRVSEFRDASKVSIFRGFLDKGQIGVYALVNSKVVGHGWAIICTKNKKYLMANGYFRLEPRQALIHYCNVALSCRGNNIYPYMIVMLCRHLFADNKISKIFIDTEIFDIAANKGVQKTGFKLIGKYFFFQVGNRLLYKKDISNGKKLCC